MIIRGKKGFTLIELLVSISIIGILALFVLPALTNMTGSNKVKKYEAYLKAFSTSSRLYIEKYGQDNWTKYQTGCIKLKLSDVINEGLIDEYSEAKNEKCDDTSSYAIISKTSATSYNYKYYTHLYCVNKKTNKVVYEASDGDKVDETKCVPTKDTTAPRLVTNSIVVWSRKSVDKTDSSSNPWSKTATFKVTITDESGLNDGQVAYGFCSGSNCTPEKWSVKNIPYREKSTSQTSYSFYITTPDDVTSNKYYAVVKIISLQDLLGNYIKNSDNIYSSTYVRVDNTPPKCDYDRTEDNRDWTNGSGSPIKKTRVFAILCNDSDRSGSTTSVNQSGCVVHNASSDDMTLTSYYASNPKGVYWGAYVWRSPDSGADYAYSSAIRNSDATRADYGRNISYGETISDRVGNTTVCTNFPTKKVNLDTTPPVCGKLTSTNGSWNNVKGHWTRQNMTISVGCTDLGADSKLKKENTSTCTQNPFTKYFNYSVTTSDIEIADYADNKVKCPMNVYLDVDYPVISFNSSATTFYQNSSVAINVSCSDSGSVRSGIRSGPSPSSFYVSSPSNGSYHGSSCTDNAGNTTNDGNYYYVYHHYGYDSSHCPITSCKGNCHYYSTYGSTSYLYNAVTACCNDSSCVGGVCTSGNNYCSGFNVTPDQHPIYIKCNYTVHAYHSYSCSTVSGCMNDGNCSYTCHRDACWSTT
jgi:prepilin-type N-terminal cleavage/methylation domain-containing protein